MTNWRAIVASCIAFALCSASAFGQRSTPKQMLHPVGAEFDRFGYSVAVDGDTMVIGSYGDTVGSNTSQGSAHVYRWTGADWAFEATLTGSEGAPLDRIGFSVAISADTIVLSIGPDITGDNLTPGEVYVFVRSGTIWTQQARLTSSDGTATDDFGMAVDIDGDTIVVGAASADIAANARQGAAYVFVRSGTAWAQQSKLVSPDGAPNDSFGESVAVSGDTLVIGARVDDIGFVNAQGSADVFVRSGTSWSHQAKLTAADGAASDWFGASVDIDQDTIVVGARLAYVDDWGAAYVFTRSGTLWSQQAKLTAPDAGTGDMFGGAVAISGNTIVVGSVGDDVGANNEQGSAYVYVRAGAVWTQQSWLMTSVGAASDFLGRSVAISGDAIVTGADGDDVGVNVDQGSAMVFWRVGTRWIGFDVQVFGSSGAAGDNFGISAAISGDTASVGAYADDVGANVDQGSAFVFTRNGVQWPEQTQRTAADGATGDDYGTSVALSGNYLIAGAYTDNVGANTDQGSAYISFRNGTTWTSQNKLTASDGGAGDVFGYATAIADPYAIVGAYSDDIGANTDQGSAYVYLRSGTLWSQQAKLVPSGGAAGDGFGVAVATDGTTAVVGAYLDDVGGNVDQGSVYVYTRVGTSWVLEAQLFASNGSAGDLFGYTVSLSGDTLVVGAIVGDTGGVFDTGAVYVFKRTAAIWNQQAMLVPAIASPGDRFGYAVSMSGEQILVGADLDDVGAEADKGTIHLFGRFGSTWQRFISASASNGLAGDRLGHSVGLSGDTLVAGQPNDDVGANADQGSAWMVTMPRNDFVAAYVASSGFVANTLSGAAASAVHGDVVTATEAAFRTATTVDTGTRAVSMVGEGDVRTPWPSVLTLGSTSSLTAPAGAVMDIFGDVAAPDGGAAATINADVMTLGSRGALVAGEASTLTVNAPVARLWGMVHAEAGGALNFLGSLLARGTLVADNAARVKVRTGSFDCPISSHTRFDLAQATLQVEGTGPEQRLEVMSADIGPDPLGLDRSIPGHFPIGTLEIGPSSSTVRLVDTHDNDGLGQSACEAIYVDELIIHAGSHLINTNCRIYYNTIVNDGAVDVSANLIEITHATACNLADVTDIGDTGAGPDSQLTVDDIIAFVNTFGDSIGCPGTARCNLADVTGIGGPPEPPEGELTVDDIIAFVNAFSDGCP